MSYDLAVWVGAPPATDDAALAEFKRWADKYEDAETPLPASPRIAAFVSALLERYPDLTTDEGEDSPWASGPMINDGMGDYLYLAMTYSGAETAYQFVVSTANAHGLVCFDPQSGTVVSSSAKTAEPGKRRWFKRDR